MQLQARLGRELALLERHLRGVSDFIKGQRDDCLAVVRIGFFPAEGVDEAARRLDLEELACEVEPVAVGWLHSEAIAAPHAEVEVYLGRCIPMRPPSSRQLSRLCERSEDPLPRRIHDELQFQDKPLPFAFMTRLSHTAALRFIGRTALTGP